MSALAVYPAVAVQSGPRHGRKPGQGSASSRRHLKVVNADFIAGVEAGRSGQLEAGRSGQLEAGRAHSGQVRTGRASGSVQAGRRLHSVNGSAGVIGSVGAARPARRVPPSGMRAGAARASVGVAARLNYQAIGSMRPSLAAARPAVAAASGGMRQWLRETTEMLMVAGGICLAAGVIAFTLLSMMRP